MIGKQGHDCPHLQTALVRGRPVLQARSLVCGKNTWSRGRHSSSGVGAYMMKSILNSTIVLLFCLAGNVFGQEQDSWKPGDSTVVFVDSGSGFTFCHSKKWTIGRLQLQKNDKPSLWLEIRDSDLNDPMNKGLDVIEHRYYLTLFPHMTTSAETWSKRDVTASHIKKMETRSKAIIECVLTDTTSGVYNGSMCRAVRYVENNYGVEISSCSFAQFNLLFLYKIANSTGFTKGKKGRP